MDQLQQPQYTLTITKFVNVWRWFLFVPTVALPLLVEIVTAASYTDPSTYGGVSGLSVYIGNITQVLLPVLFLSVLVIVPFALSFNRCLDRKRNTMSLTASVISFVIVVSVLLFSIVSSMTSSDSWAMLGLFFVVVVSIISLTALFVYLICLIVERSKLQQCMLHTGQNKKRVGSVILCVTALVFAATLVVHVWTEMDYQRLDDIRMCQNATLLMEFQDKDGKYHSYAVADYYVTREIKGERQLSSSEKSGKHKQRVRDYEHAIVDQYLLSKNGSGYIVYKNGEEIGTVENVEALINVYS